MTMQTIEGVQRGVEVTIPLNKLKRSPKNARRMAHNPADVETLAASITVKGVLQPPVVEPERDDEGQETGSYLVSIGEGRRLALSLLAKRKVIKKAEPVRCLLDQDNDPHEVSLDENVTRFAMHPADQFEAFRDLAERQGWGAEEIGARFGVSAQIVRQRLRLGAVTPKLLASYREGDLTLDQLMAFAVSEDHDRQEQVFANLSYNRSPALIRRLLTENEVEASDRRAVFVGAEAYTSAGGRIRRDLFVEDRGGWFEDVGLLDRLTIEKLRAEADRVKAEEGWRWAEAHLDFPRDHGMRRIYPTMVRPEPEEEARLLGLGLEYDALIGGQSEAEECSEDVEERLNAIDAELQAARLPVYTAEALARAGVFVVLDWEGVARIERGFIRAEDEAPEPEPSEVEEVEEPSTEPGPLSVEDQAEEDGVKPLSDRLIADLSAHRTAALQDAVATRPDVALLSVVHTLALQTFYRGAAESCLSIKATLVPLGTFADGYRESVAGKAIEARHAEWAARLPERPEELWERLQGFSDPERMGLLAHCASLSINAVVYFGQATRVRPHADQLAEAVALDMTHYWTPTAASYFDHVTKAQIMEVVREVKPEAVAAVSGMKKPDMAKAAADLIGAEGWLPPLLRTAAATPA